MPWTFALMTLSRLAYNCRSRVDAGKGAVADCWGLRWPKWWWAPIHWIVLLCCCCLSKASVLKSVGWCNAGESGLLREAPGKCFDIACSRSFTEVPPATSGASTRASDLRTLGLEGRRTCSVVGTEWLEDAGLNAWFLVGPVEVFVGGSSSSSSSPELLSSSWTYFRLCPRVRDFTVSAPMVGTAGCGSCWRWATLSWRRPPRGSLSEPRVSSRSSGGERWGFSGCWFVGPPLLRPSENRNHIEVYLCDLVEWLVHVQCSYKEN